MITKHRAYQSYGLYAVLVLLVWRTVVNGFQRTSSSSRQCTWSNPRGASTKMSLTTSDRELGDVLRAAGEGREKLDLKGVFEALTAPGSIFMEKYWQKKPVYITEEIPSLKGGWTMEDMEAAVAKEFLLAGRGFFDESRGGWKMATVGEARGISFEDAKLRPEDVRQALQKKSGTVVFNSVGASVSKLAGVCLEAVEAFRLPNALNLYLTAAGQLTSAPPHTDKQDVFVFQAQGRKRWRVYAPPIPAKKPKADPFARGKDPDQLLLEELGEPLIDTVLQPGQMLYMPAAFPHTTDTAVGIPDGTDASVHLTLGVDTHIWGLTHACLRDYVLQKAGLATSLPPLAPPSTMTDVKTFVRYHGVLPLGCREELGPNAPTRWSELRGLIASKIQHEFLARMREVDPWNAAWQGEAAGDDAAAIAERLKLKEVIEKVIDHHRDITGCFRDMYSDVKYGFTEVPRDLGFFRSPPYFAKIEADMQALVDWTTPPNDQKGPAAAAAAAEKGGEGKGGFGGGGSSGSKGGFGGSKKKTSSSTKGFGGKKKG